MDESETAAVSERMLSWARNSAAYRLSRRMMSEKQLREAISRKAAQKFEGLDQEALAVLADEAVCFGKSMGAIDDRTYADVKARSAMLGGKSRRAVAQMLGIKGIETDLARSAAEDVNELWAAVLYCRKRAYGAFRREEADPTRLNREMAALARQGFGFSLVKQVLEMDRQEAETIIAAARQG
ncbi:recombination regulator RecX [Allorhizobium sp. BGMRC 0089]|uniref:regulatory protein RecX n=1 Tax=Allorhizobium sonneratiae TaxID=2934936 RepID=UPI002033F811|nr:regulatory protein RecX [Allorhizobium sonneratiae]MCM2294093.1 recombination regulator RecX [Allorhizobium sonneratiae]